MVNLSIPTSPPPVNSTPVSAVDALADFLLFARAHHEPVPCVICDEDGRRYNITAKEGQERELCALCDGTRVVRLATSPRLSLVNIAALETLLSDLRRQGGRS